MRIGLQFVKGLSAEGAERVLTARDGVTTRACHPEGAQRLRDLASAGKIPSLRSG